MTTTNLDSAIVPNNMWVHVCKAEDLVYNSGVCALVTNKQIAIFTVFNGAILQNVSLDSSSFRNEKYAENISLYACDNYDPIGHANVLSRGLICSIKGEVCISSPLYKQHFSLITGECLEQAEYRIGIYSVKQEEGQIYIGLPTHELPNTSISGSANETKPQKSSLPC